LNNIIFSVANQVQQKGTECLVLLHRSLPNLLPHEVHYDLINHYNPRK